MFYDGVLSDLYTSHPFWLGWGRQSFELPCMIWIEGWITFGISCHLVGWNLWNLIGIFGIPSESLESHRNLWNIFRIFGISSEFSEFIFQNLWNLSKSFRIFPKIRNLLESFPRFEIFLESFPIFEIFLESFPRFEIFRNLSIEWWLKKKMQN